MQVEICSRDDDETIDRLLAVLADLGASTDDDFARPEEVGLGTGLNHFRIGNESVSLFADAWSVDLAGPTELVQSIVRALSSR